MKVSMSENTDLLLLINKYLKCFFNDRNKQNFAKMTSTRRVVPR